MRHQAPHVEAAGAVLEIAPAVPADLAGETARAVWIEVVEVLVSRRVLTRGDLLVVRELAEAKQRLHECDQLVRVQGVVVGGGKMDHLNSAETAARPLRQLVAGLLRDLGLTPTSRSKAQPAPVLEAQSEAEEALGRYGIKPMGARPKAVEVGRIPLSVVDPAPAAAPVVPVEPVVAPVAPVVPAQKGARLAAETFLRRALADGPRRAVDVAAEAEVVGIAKRTLDRARAVVGVQAGRDEVGWTWQLPANSATVPRTRR